MFRCPLVTVVDIVLREDGRLFTRDDPNVMAGSSSTMLKCMNHLAGLDFLSEEVLWQVSFANPLRVLGIDPATFQHRGPVVEFDPAANRFQVRG